MAHKAPGNHYLEGLTLFEIAEMFREEEGAKAWIAEQRWPYFPYCGSLNVQSNMKHKTMIHRCRERDGKPMFSIKAGTVMEGANLKYRVWRPASTLRGGRHGGKDFGGVQRWMLRRNGRATFWRSW